MGWVKGAIVGIGGYFVDIVRVGVGGDCVCGCWGLL